MNVRDRVVELRRVRAGDLVPNPKNWRTHPKRQQDALRGVLAEIGYADALLARELDDGRLMLVDGHLRAETTPGAEVPVLVVDLSEGEADLLLASLDPLAALADADGSKLEALLRELSPSNESVQDMLNRLAREEGISLEVQPEGEAPEPQIERAAELQAKWGTTLGQVWRIPSKSAKDTTHRLMCGDSTNGEHVAQLLDGNVPFIMATDPPYGVSYDPEWRLETGLNKEWQTRAEGKVENDDLVDWTGAYTLFPGAVAYVWHAGRHCADVVLNLRNAGFEVRTQIVWAKHSLVIGRGHYHWQHEPCFYAVRKGQTAKWCGDRTQSTLWQIPNMHRTQGSVDDGKTVHSTQKPVECMERPIRNHGKERDDVYDPFLGSGTTMVAAERVARRCFGMELSPGYCGVILERLSDMGLEPELIHG